MDDITNTSGKDKQATKHRSKEGTPPSMKLKIPKHSQNIDTSNFDSSISLSEKVKGGTKRAQESTSNSIRKKIPSASRHREPNLLFEH